MYVATGRPAQTRRKRGVPIALVRNAIPHMDADLQMMKRASGTELDRLFLEHMIPHHAGAIQIAHNALPNLEEENLQTMAMKIIESQAEEIGMLGEMLKEV